jgi:hypothetical protein
MNRRLLFPLILVALLLSGCGVSAGSGHVITESREVSNFDQVSLSSVGELVITQGDEESLEIEAEDNVVPKIETEVRERTLYISMKRPFPETVIPTKPIRFHLTMKEITGILFSGAGSIRGSSFETERLELAISGAGRVDISSLSAEELEITLSGVGDLHVAGEVPEQEVNLSGSGAYDARGLESEVTTVTISGAGSATLWVKDSLDVSISGLGSVRYYGDPAVTKNITGAGGVSSLGNP